MRERPVCYWRRIFFANETMITDNFSDPKQKFIYGARFPISASPQVRRGARRSEKLCWFTLWYGQSVRGRVIEGILNSSTFVSTINEFFTERAHKKLYRVIDSCTRQCTLSCVEKGKHISFDSLYLCFLLLPRPWMNLMIKI